ncbi:hypothetical protein [Empedobacter tilapiae]|uniref:hypothetical protein n=1 Tax=Empedobacter tilapiae TaxID=2491114 RepID=UPI0028D4AC45|nr:hypothetical protein [Empedobacter tilapiae]
MLPVIDYLVNYDKISNEYCINIERPELMCNGVCYLKEQISKTIHDEQNDDNKIQVSLRTIDYFIYQATFEIYTFTFIKPINKVSTFELAFETQYQLDQQLQPPI